MRRWNPRNGAQDNIYLRKFSPYLTPTNGVHSDRLVDMAGVLFLRCICLQVAGGGTGYLRLWFAAPEGIGAKKEAFLFVNDSEGQNEECLLICMQGVCP